LGRTLAELASADQCDARMRDKRALVIKSDASGDMSFPRRSPSTHPFLRGLRAAFTLLTRVPVGGFPYADADWRWSAAHWPLVGAFVGATWLVASLATMRAGRLVAAIVVVMVSMIVTGALHEDGLADTADALGGGRSRERVLAILKDSRIGAFGASALIVSLMLRVALIARLAPGLAAILVLIGAWSRVAPVVLVVALPYVTEPPLAKSRAVATAGRPQLLVAFAWAFVIAAGSRVVGALSYVDLGVALASGVLVTTVCGAYFRARVGGVTGDFLGASQQASECAMLLALAVARGGAM
jgi:adenosylcobinamide-GDP ribazoletransferase